MTVHDEVDFFIKGLKKLRDQSNSRIKKKYHNFLFRKILQDKTHKTQNSVSTFS